MSIKTKIIILATFSLVVIATIGFTLFQNATTARKEVEKQVIISDIRNTILEREVLRNEYFLYHEERPIIQSQALSESIEKLFLRLSNVITLADEQVSLKRLRDNSDSINQTFSRIVANSKTEVSSPSASIKELEQRLIAQILVKSQENITIASQLANASRSRAIESQNRTTIFILVFFVGSTAVLVLTLSLIWFSIAKPLITLKEAAVRIASLDFSSTTTTTTTGINSKDEIGQLARAFNEMVVKLKESYAGLEQKVRDRTQDLEEAKAKDEAILASIGDGMVVVDKEGKITYVNQAFEEMVGWKTQEVLGKYIVEVVPREDEKGDVVLFKERILTQVLSGEKVIADLTRPFYYIRKDKSRFPASSIVTSILLDGRIIGVVETFRDITKEKNIDKAKTEFVSLASHQLRTPLSTVNWYAEMLLAGDVGKVTPQQKKYLDEVYHSNQRMIDLVNALLNVSRIEMGTFIIQPLPTDVVALSKDVVKEQQPGIFKKKQVVSEKYDTNIPKINTDPKLIRMVFQNLLSNAIKYTQEKGTINLSLKKDGGNLLFTISDTGYGIPKDAQDKIFTKLFRADNAREKDTEGIGLGLYIVKSIVEQSRGKIWFESQENKGTTFYVELPLEGMKRKEGTKSLS